MTVKKAKVASKPPTWISIIKAAEKRGSFTEVEKHHAGCWATCAVGEKVSTRTQAFGLAKKNPELWLSPSSLPNSLETRSEDAAHSSADLYDAGMNFMWSVDANDFSGAREALANVRKAYRAYKASA